MDTSVESLSSCKVSLRDLSHDGMLTDVDACTNGRFAVHEKREGKRQMAATHANKALTGRCVTVVLLLLLLLLLLHHIKSFLRLDKPLAQSDKVSREQTPANKIGHLRICL